MNHDLKKLWSLYEPQTDPQEQRRLDALHMAFLAELPKPQRQQLITIEDKHDLIAEQRAYRNFIAGLSLGIQLMTQAAREL